MLIDLDDFWPPADTLVGLQFATDDDLERCRAMLAQHPDAYSWVVAPQQFVVVRRTDLSMFADAGLQYTEVQIVDPDDRPRTEAERERDRKHLREVFSAFVERLRREP